MMCGWEIDRIRKRYCPKQNAMAYTDEERRSLCRQAPGDASQKREARRGAAGRTARASACREGAPEEMAPRRLTRSIMLGNELADVLLPPALVERLRLLLRAPTPQPIATSDLNAAPAVVTIKRILLRV